MSLTLCIVSNQRQTLREKAVMTFGQDGGTIGRSLETDWSLPDTKRYMSSRHASIDFRSGSYYIVDTSRNGVFVNDAEEPVGHGKPQRLFTGDRIRIGEYEMTVAIDEEDDGRESLFESNHVDPVDLKQHVDAPEPTSYDLIDAHTITGVGIEMFIADDEAEKEPAKPTPISESAAESPPHRNPLDAFFRAAGMTPPELDARQSEAMLTRLGQVTRELVAGFVDCLHLQALQKAHLKHPGAITQQPDAAGLELAANAEEALAQLFPEDPARHANPVETVRTALAGLQSHQRALLNAMRRALDEYLDRLEPEQLQRQATHGRTGTLITAANKLRYWDLYKDVYTILANRPADELPEPFVAAFSHAYAEEMARPAPGTSADVSQKAS
jgi:type VI secretion system protein ImpI